MREEKSSHHPEDQERPQPQTRQAERIFEVKGAVCPVRRDFPVTDCRDDDCGEHADDHGDSKPRQSVAHPNPRRLGVWMKSDQEPGDEPEPDPYAAAGTAPGSGGPAGSLTSRARVVS
ncbi:MAG TPA: hypothetical protein VE197_10865 [Mycobacterium sp.]|nr:hypothetical protein [Mycobacterium sp.]